MQHMHQNQKFYLFIFTFPVTDMKYNTQVS